MLETYTTLDGQVIDLSALTQVEEGFFVRVLTLYRQKAAYEMVDQLVHGTENPLLATTDGVITRAVYSHTLYRTVRDMMDRLGIQQGELGAAAGDSVDDDPTADEWLPVAQAAGLKGVTVPGLHGAIKAGEVIARPAKEGGSRLVVSRRSLDSYHPSAARQHAGRQSRKPAEE